MPVSSRRVLVPLALSAALCLPACSDPPEMLTCETETDCPAATRCISRGCVANSPPAAAVALPEGEIQANLLHAFDGSASSDPDEGDAVASFAWVFRSLDAQCGPPAVASTGPVASVRFACPGRYAVDLTAVDAMLAEGRSTVEFAVAPYTGPALVVAAADVALDHACTGSPLRCAPAETVTLGAIAPGFAPGEVSFSWTFDPPPDRPMDGSRRVSFEPGPDVAAPEAIIETDGTAISGDWVFRVEARDEAGVLGTAAMRVSVGNRPPVVTGTAPSQVNHRFLGDRFTASGEIAVGVNDPDGDPIVERTARWRKTGDRPVDVFAGVDELTRLTFSVVVPYAVPADALHLIGAPGLARSVELEVADANGARTAASWAIAVVNRPPVLVSTPAPTTVNHLYDPGRLAYLATATLSTWSDPDGGPLFPVPGAATGDPLCPIAVDAAGVARAECRLAFQGTPSLSSLTGTHVVTQHVQDPWVAASPASATFTIGNRPPVLVSTEPYSIPVDCIDGCCRYDFEGACAVAEFTSSGGSAVVPPRWIDPDGDPLEVSLGTLAPFVCAEHPCPFQLSVAPISVCGPGPVESAQVAVSDDVADASFSIRILRACR